MSLRYLVVLPLVTVAAGLLPLPAHAAAPRYMMVSGLGLPRPVLLDDRHENHAILLALADAPRVGRAAAKVQRRPRLRLTLFWGWLLERPPTSPSQGDQRGWFYPACGTRRAVIDLRVNGQRVVRVAPTALVPIFTERGIPVRRRSCALRT